MLLLFVVSVAVVAVVARKCARGPTDAQEKHACITRKKTIPGRPAAVSMLFIVRDRPSFWTRQGLFGPYHTSFSVGGVRAKSQGVEPRYTAVAYWPV